MEPFRTEDHERFFGRDDLVRELLAATGCAEASDDDPGDTGDHPVVLVGSSGVGKSSLLRAGLLAGLDRAHEADPASPWPAVLLPAPGARPLRALAERLEAATGTPRAEVERHLSAGRLPVAASRPGGCAVLVIDQFEEVFTQCTDPEERDRFIRAVCGGRSTAAGRIRVVLGLRADHYGSCLAHPDLMRALRAGQVTVAPMDDAGLRAAIEQPARDNGLVLQPGLTDLLLRDLREGSGSDLGTALPFLAHALRSTWHRRLGHTLTLVGYQATGGIWQSVTRTAEEIHDALEEPGRLALRELLLRMVHLGGSAGAVPGRIDLGEATRGRSEVERQLLALLLDRLTRARLVTVDDSGARIAHEALLRAWPRLRQWIDEDRAGLIVRQQLADATDVWHLAGRDPAFCYRGVRLAAAREWAADVRHEHLLRAADREFLAASIQAQEAEQARERRRVRRLRQILASLALVLALSVLATAVAIQQRSNARHSGQAATVRQLEAAAVSAIGTDPRSALLLGVSAYRRDPSPASRAALLDVMAATQFSGAIEDLPNLVGTLAYSGDGRMLVVGTGEGTTQLWDVSRPDHRRRLAEVVPHGKPSFLQTVMACWLDPSGQRLSLLGRDGVLGMFDLADPAHPVGLGSVPVRPGNIAVQAGGFSPDGHTLVAVLAGAPSATGAAAGTSVPVVWAVGDRDHPAEVGRLSQLAAHSGPLKSVTFALDGRLVALGWQDGTTELWDLTDRAHPVRRSVLEPTGRPAVLAVAFSPDGRTLATGTDDAQARLWDLRDLAQPRQTAVLGGHNGAISAVAFGPDGRSLATASMDRSVVLWDVTGARTASRAAVMSGHRSGVRAVAFAPDGRTLASGDNDAVLLWSLTDRLVPVRSAQPIVGNAPSYQSPYTSLRFSTLDPTGSLLATWDADGRPVLTLLTGRSAGQDAGTVDVPGTPRVAFSRDGRTLAAGARDGTVTVWDVAHPAAPMTTSRFHPAGPARTITQLSLSSDGTLVAVGVLEGPATVWDISDRGHPVQLASLVGRSAAGCTPQFSPRGHLLACGGDLYDLADPRRPVMRTSLRDPDHPGLRLSGTIAFSPVADLLAIHPFWASAYLFDVSAPARPRFRAHVHAEVPVPVMTFSPEGRILAAADGGDEIVLWDVTFPAQPHRVAAVTLQSYPRGTAFADHGNTLVTYDEYGNVVRWNIAALRAALDDPVGRACRLVAGNPTRAQWSSIAPGVPFGRICPAFPAEPEGVPPLLGSRSSPIPAG
jgi:WD40 repeat protein